MKTFKSLLTGSIVLLWAFLIITITGIKEARSEDTFSIFSYLDDSIFINEDVTQSGDMPQYILDRTALYLQSFTTSGRELFQQWLCRALAAETRNYIPKFMAAMIIAKNPGEFGFTFTEVPTFQYDLLEVPAGMHVRTISERSGISLELIRSINPELKGNITPLSTSRYILRLPKGIGTVFLENFEHLLPDKRVVVYKEYKVRKGDSLYKIAKKFQTP